MAARVLSGVVITAGFGCRVRLTWWVVEGLAWCLYPEGVRHGAVVRDRACVYGRGGLGPRSAPMSRHTVMGSGPGAVRP